MPHDLARGRAPRGGWRGVSADPRKLIAVRPEVVMTTMVEDLHAAALERAAEPLPVAVEAALAEAVQAVAQPAEPALGPALHLARLGYVTRALEVERYVPARRPMPWLADTLRKRGGTGAAALSAELAGAEPTERPAPNDPHAVSWRVPGPGGHVRHFLALRAAQDPPATGLDEATAKRLWLSGFVLACCREADSR
jgi:hypothetical protein